jgi:hypothetical protein
MKIKGAAAECIGCGLGLRLTGKPFLWLLSSSLRQSMNKDALKKRRIAAVKKILAKKLPADMKHYWLGVLRALQPWIMEKRNLGIK